MVTCNPSRTPVDIESKLDDDGDPDSDPNLYRSLVGSFQYLTFTQPDIFYAIQQGALNYGIQLFASTTSMVAYSDVDWRQRTLSLYSFEADYRSVAYVVAKTCWLHNLLHELHTSLSFVNLVYCDN
nr:hypothetical protein [Tanacetum cinerariifolium]